MIDLEREADYLHILTTLLERSLVDQKDENKKLNKAKKDLRKAWRDLITAEKNLENKNLKG